MGLPNYEEIWGQKLDEYEKMRADEENFEKMLEN